MIDVVMKATQLTTIATDGIHFSAENTFDIEDYLLFFHVIF